MQELLLCWRVLLHKVCSVVILEESPCRTGSSRTNLQVLVIVLIPAVFDNKTTLKMCNVKSLLLNVIRNIKVLLTLSFNSIYHRFIKNDVPTTKSTRPISLLTVDG